MLGFEYNGQHSSDYDVVAKSVNRPAFPEKRKREVSVPGKFGTYDFGLNRYGNRMIGLDIGFIGTSFIDLRSKARLISEWLRQTTYCELIFDDEPDKHYAAKIYNEIGLENLFRFGKANLMFECQPLAQGVVTSAEDVLLDSSVSLESDLVLTPGDEFTISV